MRNHNEGQDIVFIGHSQGSHILTKLLKDKFDNDDALRAQLISAVLMGPKASRKSRRPTGGWNIREHPTLRERVETGA